MIDHLSGGLARVFDLAWLLVAAQFCYYWRFSSWLMPVAFQTAALLGALLALMSYSMFKVYESWRGRKKIHLFGLIVSAHLSAFAVLMGFLVFSQHSIYFSRLWLAGWICLSLIGVIGFRIFVYELLDRLREKGINHKRLILIGDHDSSQNVIKALQSKPWLGLEVIKVFLTGSQNTLDIQKDRPQDSEQLQTQVYHFGRSSIEADIKTHGATEVWISLPLREEGLVRKVLYDLRHSTVNIRYFPSFDDLRLLNHSSKVVAGMPVFDLSCSPLDGINRVIKHFEDRLLGTLIFLLVSPLMLFIAVGVKLSSPGPVLFKQYRQGIDGQRINIYKFRSMRLHAEDEGHVTQASKGDNRITPFGQFLRRTSLDELPQFFNVIQGKMSIVGPRPHALEHNEYYKEEIDYYLKRHKVKPGITGWAQINGFRGQTDTLEKMRKRIEYDLFYIENWSLLFDLKIIVLTCFKGFIHKNAY